MSSDDSHERIPDDWVWDNVKYPWFIDARGETVKFPSLPWSQPGADPVADIQDELQRAFERGL